MYITTPQMVKKRKQNSISAALLFLAAFGSPLHSLTDFLSFRCLDIDYPLLYLLFEIHSKFKEKSSSKKLNCENLLIIYIFLYIYILHLRFI